MPVVFASVDDVRGSFAAFIEEHVDKKEEVWKCGICKIVLPEGFHIGGSAERARQRVLKQGGMKVSIIYTINSTWKTVLRFRECVQV